MRHLPNCLLMLFFLTQFCFAEIFMYEGPDGERVISDHPVKSQGYQLIMTKKSLRHLGQLLSNRVPDCSGTRQCFKDSIANASRRYQIDPALVEAVIETESGFNPAAMSNKGATGLMQLMDSTADGYNVSNSMNPDDNIHAGVKHLSMLMTRFDHQLPLVLAAYNAGAAAVEHFGGIPPYPETERFVKKVMDSYDRIRGDRN